MSNRNGRRAAPATAVKATKGRRASVASTSTFDLSSNDNDNYSGVDDISDDEDDDEDVFAVEERAMMGETTPSPPSTPRPRLSTIEEWDHDGDDDDSDDDNDDEGGSVTANDDSDDDDGSWSGIKSDPADVPTSDGYDYQTHFDNPRRVRFDVPSDDDDGSSSDSTEDDHAEMYPDIFVDQSTLDPSFRRQIENEWDESSASDSFWDHTALYPGYFENESEADGVTDQFDRQTVAAIAESLASHNNEDPSPRMEDDMASPNDLDGYESDGETTEDDEFPEPPIRRKTRRPSVEEEEASESDSDGGAPVRRKKDQPRVSSFELNMLDGKPIGVFDTKTGKMIIFTPDTRGFDLSPEAFHNEALHVFQQMGNQMSPLTGNGAGLMFDSLTSNMFMNNLTGEEWEDMLALQAADHSPTSLDGDDPLGPRDSDADPETGLKVSDFLDLDDDYSSNDEDGDKTLQPSSTPMRPTTASSDADVLSHLNPATVGAFRRNQVNSQLMIRNQATQDSLDFSGPYNSTALRGIRSDRFDTAGVPLTPVRRHKKQLSDLARSPLDPVSTKRKAVGEILNGGHKKQKSISDVGALHL